MKTIIKFLSRNEKPGHKTSISTKFSFTTGSYTFREFKVPRGKLTHSIVFEKSLLSSMYIMYVRTFGPVRPPKPG